MYEIVLSTPNGEQLVVRPDLRAISAAAGKDSQKSSEGCGSTVGINITCNNAPVQVNQTKTDSLSHVRVDNGHYECSSSKMFASLRENFNNSKKFMENLAKKQETFERNYLNNSNDVSKGRLELFRMLFDAREVESSILNSLQTLESVSTPVTDQQNVKNSQHKPVDDAIDFNTASQVNGDMNMEIAQIESPTTDPSAGFEVSTDSGIDLTSKQNDETADENVPANVEDDTISMDEGLKMDVVQVESSTCTDPSAGLELSSGDSKISSTNVQNDEMVVENTPGNVEHETFHSISQVDEVLNTEVERCADQSAGLEVTSHDSEMNLKSVQDNEMVVENTPGDVEHETFHSISQIDKVLNTEVESSRCTDQSAGLEVTSQDSEMDSINVLNNKMVVENIPDDVEDEVFHSSISQIDKVLNMEFDKCTDQSAGLEVFSKNSEIDSTSVQDNEMIEHEISHSISQIDGILNTEFVEAGSSRCTKLSAGLEVFSGDSEVDSISMKDNEMVVENAPGDVEQETFHSISQIDKVLNMEFERSTDPSVGLEVSSRDSEMDSISMKDDEMVVENTPGDVEHETFHSISQIDEVLNMEVGEVESARLTDPSARPGDILSMPSTCARNDKIDDNTCALSDDQDEVIELNSNSKIDQIPNEVERFTNLNFAELDEMIFFSSDDEKDSLCEEKGKSISASVSEMTSVIENEDKELNPISEIVQTPNEIKSSINPSPEEIVFSSSDDEIDSVGELDKSKSASISEISDVDDAAPELNSASDIVQIPNEVDSSRLENLSPASVEIISISDSETDSLRRRENEMDENISAFSDIEDDDPFVFNPTAVVDQILNEIEKRNSRLLFYSQSSEREVSQINSIRSYVSSRLTNSSTTPDEVISLSSDDGKESSCLQKCEIEGNIPASNNVQDNALKFNCSSEIDTTPEAVERLTNVSAPPDEIIGSSEDEEATACERRNDTDCENMLASSVTENDAIECNTMSEIERPIDEVESSRLTSSSNDDEEDTVREQTVGIGGNELASNGVRDDVECNSTSEVVQIPNGVESSRLTSSSSDDEEDIQCEQINKIDEHNLASNDVRDDVEFNPPSEIVRIPNEVETLKSSSRVEEMTDSDLDILETEKSMNLSTSQPSPVSVQTCPSTRQDKRAEDSSSDDEIMTSSCRLGSQETSARRMDADVFVDCNRKEPASSNAKGSKRKMDDDSSDDERRIEKARKMFDERPIDRIRKKMLQDDLTASEAEDVKRKRRRSSSVSSNSSASSSDESGAPKKKKSKGRTSEFISYDAAASSTPGKGRKNIREIMGDEELGQETRKVSKEEEARKKRVEEKRILLNRIENEGTSRKKLILDYDQKTKKILIEVHPKIVEKLKPHQAEGIRFMFDACYESVARAAAGKGGGCILAHCMGLGKTFQTIALIHTLLSTKKIKTKTVLVLCPLTTVSNWIIEFEEWLADVENGTKDVKTYDIQPIKDRGPRAMFLRRWHNQGGVMILSYQLFRSLVSTKDDEKLTPRELTHAREIRSLLLNPGPDLVVCDEGHLLKNENTLLSQAAMSIRTRRRIVMTGTPLQNNLNEYHTIIQFIKQDLLGNKEEFLNRFVNPVTNGQFRDSRSEDVALMQTRSYVLNRKCSGVQQRFDLSVLKSCLEPKYEYVLLVGLSDLQAKLYQHYIDNKTSITDGGKATGLFGDHNWLLLIWNHPLTLKLSAENPKKQKSNAKGAQPIKVENQWWRRLVALNDLENASNGPKLLLLLDILRQCEKMNDKLLVFSTSLPTLDMIEYFLQQENFGAWKKDTDYYRMDGTVPNPKRAKQIKLFNSPDNKRARLYLLSPQACGLGINLTAANRVILFDASWNPAQDSQSVFRAYRLGQKKPCYIYRFVAQGTMEEPIYKRQVTKLSVSCRVVDEQQIERHYMQSSIKELYRFDRKFPTGEVFKFPSDDNVMAELLKNHRNIILSYHEHDSLLENIEEEELDDDVKLDAWQNYEVESALKTNSEEMRVSASPKNTDPSSNSTGERSESLSKTCVALAASTSKPSNSSSVQVKDLSKTTSVASTASASNSPLPTKASSKTLASPVPDAAKLKDKVSHKSGDDLGDHSYTNVPSDKSYSEVENQLDDHAYASFSSDESNYESAIEATLPVTNEEIAPVVDELVLPVAKEPVVPAAIERISPEASEAVSPMEVEASEETSPQANKENDVVLPITNKKVEPVPLVYDFITFGGVESKTPINESPLITGLRQQCRWWWSSGEGN